MKSNLARTPEVSSESSHETTVLPSFAELGLPEKIAELVKTLGYEVPTPIQARSIPVLLSGRDLIGQAQTGTGKTAAFALPLLSKIDFQLDEPQILVLTPTRELAIQVAEAFQSYARNQESFHVLPIYGGQSIGVQLKQLRRKPQVIVGTPGRVMDHLRRETLSLSSLKALVIDEADEMLSMGFLEDMEWIITHTPKEKQTALFSATMPKAIRRIAQSYLQNPEEVVIKQVASQAALITQAYWFVNGMHKLDALTRVLEMNDFDGVLIFVRTKTATVELAERLEARGYSAGALNGDMSQEARERTVDRLKQGRLDIVVATDVAARGLDVERISHVINFDIPYDAETYTHRIGRTGRAGRSGTALLFVSDREQGLLRSIERGCGGRMEKFVMPTREDVAKKKIDVFKEKVLSVLSGVDLETQLGIVDSLVHENEVSEKNVAAALCYLLNAGVRPKAEKKEKDPQLSVRMETRPFERRGERKPDRERRPERERKFGDRTRPWSEKPPQRGPKSGPTSGPKAGPRGDHKPSGPKKRWSKKD